MNEIRLPAGTLHVRFDKLAKLLACALHPESGDDADNYDAVFAQFEYEGGKLRRAVESGELVVKNPLTRLPLSFIVGHALNRGVVMIDDLQAFASGLGLSVIVEAPEQAAPAQSTVEPAPVAPSASDAPETEWHLLATAEQLCAAFGAFTGMNEDWFGKLGDKPVLKAARFQPGEGGRNKREPLFYVYPVLQWLIDKRRKTGKPMQEATGWRMLKQHFPRVYEAYELSAPDPD